MISNKEIIAFSFGGFGYLSYLCSQRVGGAASKRLVMTDGLGNALVFHEVLEYDVVDGICNCQHTWGLF